MRQERVHPLVCLLPPFSTEEWQKPMDLNTQKGKHNKKSAQRQTRGCSNLLREKQASVLERLEWDRVPRERESGIRRSGAELKNGCCASVFLIPSSVLPISCCGGNWSVRVLVAPRLYDSGCCCRCSCLCWSVQHSLLSRAKTCDDDATTWCDTQNDRNNNRRRKN